MSTEKKQAGLSREHVRLAQVAESMLSEPDKKFSERFETLLELSAKHDHIRDQALLTAAVVLRDILPNYRVGGGQKGEESKNFRTQVHSEEKLVKATRTLVGKLKVRGLVRGMGLLLETGSPIVSAACGDQLVEALVGATVRGNAEASEILKRTVEEDGDLDTSAKIVKAITRQKQKDVNAELLGVLEKVKTDVSSRSRGAMNRDIEQLEDEELKRDLLVTSTGRDLKKIAENERSILADILVFAVKFFRLEKNASVECVRSVLRTLRIHALLVNVELSTEIAHELRTVFLAQTDSGPILIELFTTILTLLKNLETVGGVFSSTLFVAQMVRRLKEAVASCELDQVLLLASELVKIAQNATLDTQEEVAAILFGCITVHPDGSRVFAAQLFTLFARGKLELRCALDRGGQFHETLRLLEHSVDPQVAATLNDLWQFSEFPERAKKSRSQGPAAADQTALLSVLKSWTASVV